MSWYEITETLPSVIRLLFVLSFGACVGSLVNVLVYRMPLGLSVITPPSRCPSCETRLTWRENVPVLGWLLLGGKCRFCKSPISPEYPIVEAIVGIGFVAIFWLVHVAPEGFVLQPEWAANASPELPVLPITLVWWCLFACLVAMTLVDAKTSTIPLVLAWIPAVFAVVLLPAHAAWLTLQHGEMEFIESLGWAFTDGPEWISEEGWMWAIPAVEPYNWGMLGGVLGALVGLGASAVLVETKLLRRSFADYEEWEKGAIVEAERELEAAVARGAMTRAEVRENPAAMWIRYPHARREMVKEILFLAVPAMLAMGGSFAAAALGGDSAMPLWLSVLGGVVLGYLAGGGIVWAVRIFGSIAFGKEAMGIGDVHLMAGVGACLGWIDPVLAFFGAAFVAIFWTILGMVLGGGFRRAMPYGPYLAVATVLVVLGKPWIEEAMRIAWGPLAPAGLP